jgi:hypothetical protein
MMLPLIISPPVNAELPHWFEVVFSALVLDSSQPTFSSPDRSARARPGAGRFAA